MTNETESNNPSRPQAAAPFNLNTNTKKGLVVAIVVFLLLIVFGIIASRSLPGEALYGFKTSVIEELNRSVQFGTEAGANHEISRLEQRLDEIKRLKEKGPLSDSARTALENMVLKHSKAVTAAVQDQNSMLTPTDKLSLLERYAGVAAAMETVSESDPELTALGDFMEDRRREAVSLYREQVDRFVERETPANIFEFIKQLLSNVSNELQNGNLTENTIDDAEVYINRVGPAMAEGDYPKAINSIAEAMRFIAVEKYGANVESDEAPSTDDTSTSTEEAVTPTSTPASSTPTPAPSAPTGSTFTFPE
jgi:hypothetical protein